jgi:sugar/nucleoside kinase (ribokinase family)
MRKKARISARSPASAAPFGIRHSAFDILGLGCAAVDDILYVPSYPPADAKVEVRARERHCGGLCATALVAASRLGARCAYAGTLGADESSRFVLDRLKREGVDVRQVIRRDGAGPVRSVIVVEEMRRTRTIFYDPRSAVGANPRLPAKEVILSARVLMVDRFGISGMIRAARIARSAGIAVVGDFESENLPRFRELIALTDHLILSRNFACRLTGARSASAAAAALWRADRHAVVITCGAEGCWFLEDRNRKARHLPAFRIQALDTTGCGDVFHGAYAAALARGMELIDRLRLASAAAAIKATRHGGQSGIPTLAAVKSFLQHQRS